MLKVWNTIFNVTAEVVHVVARIEPNAGDHLNINKFTYCLVFAGDVAANIAECLWDGSQPNMLQHLIPSSSPYPYFAITICCINRVIGHFEGHHPASLGPELSTFGELRELPHPHKVWVRASVDQTIWWQGNGEDLSIVSEDWRGTVVSGLRFRIREFCGRRRRGRGWELTVVKWRGNRRVLEATRKSGTREAWWGVNEVWERGFFSRMASQEVALRCCGCGCGSKSKGCGGIRWVGVVHWSGRSLIFSSSTPKERSVVCLGGYDLWMKLVWCEVWWGHELEGW